MGARVKCEYSTVSRVARVRTTDGGQPNVTLGDITVFVCSEQVTGPVVYKWGGRLVHCEQLCLRALDQMYVGNVRSDKPVLLVGQWWSG